MKALNLVSLLLFTTIVVACHSLLAQDSVISLPEIKVVGNQFKLESGQPFVFRGLCLADPDKLEKSGNWNRRYFEQARKWHANVVRIPIHPKTWRLSNRKAYFQLLDDGVRWATELGIYVILDWHSIGNLDAELFQHQRYKTTKKETLQFWKSIAEHYKGNTTIACYELFNEPTAGNGKLGHLEWQKHKTLMEELIAVVRAHDKSVIPLVGGLDWAYDLSEVRQAPINAFAIAYSVHPYPQKCSPPWEEKWESDFGYVADNYPIVATELGFTSANSPKAHVPVIGDETYGEAIISFLELKGISWTVWCFDPHYSPELIQNWTFAPTRQGRFFKAKLTELSAKNRL